MECCGSALVECCPQAQICAILVRLPNLLGNVKPWQPRRNMHGAHLQMGFCNRHLAALPRSMLRHLRAANDSMLTRTCRCSCRRVRILQLCVDA